ncbi:MAG: S8 family peptidase [Saprospiraceae bacterium]|jgi:subtilisin family serine protease|nr:S8 family peptidase [Saprospiraceae bacterium]MBK6478842.1 S8 family peptidase [Saprospiraceae bacterium]MBK6816757.1 S8 family peptidase [Saprospiraceae bacterium]MBK7371285.1 S8 family peptidase [Saprospiraceae bacterium]MBK7436221.1 S8 family peptidase [Saprospiraceae bacterium]
MTSKSSLLLIILVLSCSALQGQKDWIIQLKGDASLADLQAGWSKTALRSNRDLTTQPIGRHFNIYAIQSVTQLSKETLLRNPAILYAEPNLPLETRSTPNDPLISQQWHLDNIQAIKAWDQTTGGVTFNKDTLVLGIIDFGLFTNHEDLKNRIWINKGEIAGNGIDDDGNGYKDDVYGLSLKYLNERHTADNAADGLNNHGTSVAGLMCGESNNRTGIAGMMWNSKLMVGTFSANGNIGDLIQIFNYMLDQRILYNTSGGKKGALVVAINYSGGISFAKAADYPIWCGMYDQMGAAGILNCGATTNKYVDVDEEGDMPSTCPSEFLIAVTNTGRDNKRIYNAGFGLQHIDLGSPGEGVYSTNSETTKSYSSFSGTSAATPIVAGVVGLLYSYPCKEWADYTVSHPVEAARIVKKSLLASVDKNADLTGKTVSGGRINAARALDTLKKYVCNRVITGTTDQLSVKAVYPNPAKDFLNFELDSNYAGDYTIELYDVLGRVILQKRPTYINHSYQLSLPPLHSGMYLLRLSNGANEAVKKVFIGS